jgi:antitoxin ParD1/3/4
MGGKKMSFFYYRTLKKEKYVLRW